MKRSPRSRSWTHPSPPNISSCAFVNPASCSSPCPPPAPAELLKLQMPGTTPAEVQVRWSRARARRHNFFFLKLLGGFNVQPKLRIAVLHNPTNLCIGESSVWVSKPNYQVYLQSFKKRHGEAPLDKVCAPAGPEDGQRFDIFNEPTKD